MGRSTGRFMAAVVLPLLIPGAVAQAQQMQIDPATVSEGLKAIFRYGNSSKETAGRLNANTVTVMSGTIGGTYVQFGADLASVLDDGDRLRILPIVGRGSVQSIADILFLKGVDLGIVRADTLDYLEKQGYATSIKKQFTYITKLYNEEMHVVASKAIRSLADLDGKTVSVDLPNGGTFVTSIIIFERLGIKPNFVYIEQRVAFEKLRKGEIDALIAVQGRPSKFISQIKDDRLHLVPIDYAKPLQSDYLPSQLTSDDYPNLVPAGGRVDTVAVPAVLAAYNWPANSERFRKVAHFVEAFFAKFSAFQQPPFHPKWNEVVLTAPLRGWTRFGPAQEWLDRHTAMASSDVRSSFQRFLAESAPGRNGLARMDSAEPNEALFRQFIDWQKKQRPPR
jgi:TRAP transporter TAXI family solute receptor